jgi:hypothetical protein
MGIAGLAAAHEARLQAYEVSMLLVAIAREYFCRPRRQSEALSGCGGPQLRMTAGLPALPYAPGPAGPPGGAFLALAPVAVFLALPALLMAFLSLPLDEPCVFRCEAVLRLKALPSAAGSLFARFEARNLGQELLARGRPPVWIERSRAT